MAGSISVDDVIKQIEDAATAATNPDEKALQIDYNALRDNIRKALGTRKVVLMHINRFLPEGYEDQGRFNALLLTGGKIVYDMVIGDSYFRYDIVSVGDLDKIQLIDAVWENREKRREEPFLSLRLMHADETHLLLAMDNDERQSLLSFAEALSNARHPEA
jgi:hypothetical protein